ncbi:MAG: A/G-specific adenine glycosylase [Alphaproteobacteria bacterium]|nr:A/G-specific adenine glycosylase [Alphaproteobacteria bacterium]
MTDITVKLTTTQPTLPQIKPAALRKVHSALQRWYEAHGRRDLPWRNTTDPYAIWVSEVMLQQTQVKTVLDRYYAPFLKRFPSIRALAEAPRDVLMKEWEGLGYYSRANNLQRAAQLCVDMHGGQLPRDMDALLALPGIGINTAHALMAFAYHAPVAVMEANVKRVLCRLFALSSPSDTELWSRAQTMVDAKRPFDFNQAMMDIGATVCTKRSPLCLTCPLSSMCMGKNAPELYPAPKTPKVTPVRERVIVAWRNESGWYHIAQRQSRFLNGLYGFDEYDTAPDGITIIGEVEQTYSHFQLKASVGVGHAAGLNIGEYRPLDAIASLPLSRADAKVLKLIEAYDVRFAKAARKKI